MGFDEVEQYKELFDESVCKNRVGSGMSDENYFDMCTADISVHQAMTSHLT